jgi:hypothetical protein
MLRIKLNSDRFSKVSLARRFDLIGFSHPKASYFLLRRQKKVTKDKSVWNRFGCEVRAARVPGRHESAGDPVAACILCSSLLCPLWVFDEGCQKGHPWPSGNALHPCSAPSGCSLGTSLCLALWVRCMQIGYPADLSRRKLRCSARQTGQNRPCVTSVTQ